ncbi:hypothetical protein QVD17_39275 [Tagetes erecta]|uniref:Uncharacterized protein n=1 Tax=Tagetes erecta TaxID=13708 RepID=A0AAD8JQF0_TARER|nr:hypothetical protein QVD17_39275 [Tagetes erecta]
MDTLRHSRRRSKSFTLSDDHSATFSTPLHYLSIPFSWEQFPGIPKKNTHKKTDSSQSLLPLPPSTNPGHQTRVVKKYSNNRSFRKDPFFAAFVECSKDNEFESKNSTSDRSGFVVSMYSSCKRTCAVSESIVYRPRSSRGYVLATDHEDVNIAKSKA